MARRATFNISAVNQISCRAKSKETSQLDICLSRRANLLNWGNFNVNQKTEKRPSVKMVSKIINPRGKRSSGAMIACSAGIKMTFFFFAPHFFLGDASSGGVDVETIAFLPFFFLKSEEKEERQLGLAKRSFPQ